MENLIMNAEPVREEHLQQTQELLEATVIAARTAAMNLEELTELLRLTYEE